MALRPIHLIFFPLVIFILMGVILDSAVAWQNTCGLDLSCNNSISIFPHNSLLFLLMTGDMSVFWTMLQSPSFGFSAISAVFSIVIGAVLSILALGIIVAGSVQVVASGASGELGSNPQGTKMAQAIGPGLLIWGLVQLSMSGWEAYFDNYIVGLAILFNLILELMFLGGLWWMLQSYS